MQFNNNNAQANFHLNVLMEVVVNHQSYVQHNKLVHQNTLDVGIMLV